jgi:VanZ family protein
VRPAPIRSRSLRAILLIWLIVAVSITHYYALFAHAHSYLLAALVDRPDFVFHLVAFALMALPAFLLWRPVSTVAVGLVALAGAIELSQMMIPDREASLADLGASGAGIVLGALAAMLVSDLGVWFSGALTKVD